MLTTLRRRWRALWNPDMYHGWHRQRQYFEGWYFKVVAPAQGVDTAAALAFIPGIAMEADGRQHAFVQVLDGRAARGYYYEFPASDFVPDPERFAVRIGDNYFSTDRLEVALPDFSGSLRMHDLYPWPRSLGAPGIMGWYSFVPFMQCYHGVTSLHHRLEGSLSVLGQSVDFSTGVGYTEKDWGQSFPSSWIWAQSNHFEYPQPSSLFLSVARIPWLGSHFVGFLAGFLWQGQVHRLATYTGARLRVRAQEGSIWVSMEDNRCRLEVEGVPGPGANLASPLSGHMSGKVNESLQARLHVKFWLRGQLQYDGPAYHAGLEVAGPVQSQLITE